MKTNITANTAFIGWGRTKTLKNKEQKYVPNNGVRDIELV